MISNFSLYDADEVEAACAQAANRYCGYRHRWLDQIRDGTRTKAEVGNSSPWGDSKKLYYGLS